MRTTPLLLVALATPWASNPLLKLIMIKNPCRLSLHLVDVVDNHDYGE